MEIRKVRKRDISIITKLNNFERNWVGFKNKKFFEKYLHIPIFYVAKSDSNLVGFAMVMDNKTEYKSKNFIWFKKRYSKFFYIDRIVIHPNFRGKGIGTELYKKILSKLKNKTVVCEVSIKPRNNESISFHRKLGFKKAGINFVQNKKNIMLLKTKSQKP